MHVKTKVSVDTEITIAVDTIHKWRSRKKDANCKYIEKKYLLSLIYPFILSNTSKIKME